MKDTRGISSHPERQILQETEPEDAGILRDALQLHEISTLLLEDRDVTSLYGRIIDTAMQVLAADMASMQVYHPERKELELVTWRGLHPASAAYWEWIGFESASSCGLALKSGCRVVVPDTETWELAAGTRNLDEYRRSGIRAMQSTPLIARSGRLLGMISTHWRKPHVPAQSALHLLDVIARQAADLVERSNTEVELRGNAQRLRWLASIVELSKDAIISIDLDGTLTSWNRGAERIFGYTVAEVIGHPVTILIPPDRHTEELDIIERIRRGERIEDYETVRCRKDGSELTVSLSVSPIENTDGTIVGASKITRDITEQKRGEERMAMLASEAEHRARNILAAVRATVNLSQAETPDELKQTIVGRVQALANVHALFVESRWSGAELSHLAAQELAPYLDVGDGRARIVGPAVLLAPDAAQSIAVVLHELTTNAAKYGALSTADGHVDIEWTHAAGGHLELAWSERGGPPVTAPERKGFGTRVMDQVIRSLPDGAIQFDWQADGLRCHIAIRT